MVVLAVYKRRNCSRP